MKTRIVIVDDQVVVREGLKRLLEIDSEIEIVGEAANGLECLNLIKDASPEVVLIDLKMPGISGMETIQLILRNYSHVKVIIFTNYEDAQIVTKSVMFGAHGYLLKSAGREELISAINHVVKGRSYLDPAITSIVLNQLKAGRFETQSTKEVLLTRRELEVLQAIVIGLTDRQPATQMCISEYTVRSHTKNIFRKLRVSSKSQAAVKAIKLGIVS